MNKSLKLIQTIFLMHFDDAKLAITFSLEEKIEMHFFKRYVFTFLSNLLLILREIERKILIFIAVVVQNKKDIFLYKKINYFL